MKKPVSQSITYKLDYYIHVCLFCIQSKSGKAIKKKKNLRHETAHYESDFTTHLVKFSVVKVMGKEIASFSQIRSKF